MQISCCAELHTVRAQALYALTTARSLIAVSTHKRSLFEASDVSHSSNTFLSGPCICYI